MLALPLALPMTLTDCTRHIQLLLVLTRDTAEFRNVINKETISQPGSSVGTSLYLTQRAGDRTGRVWVSHNLLYPTHCTGSRLCPQTINRAAAHTTWSSRTSCFKMNQKQPYQIVMENISTPRSLSCTTGPDCLRSSVFTCVGSKGFLTVDITLIFQLRLFEMVNIRNLKWLTCFPAGQLSILWF